jgi:hypothetical protein
VRSCQEACLLFEELAALFSFESTAFNIVLGVRCVGPIERSALQAAIEGLIRRHPQLRAAFERVPMPPVERERRLMTFGRRGLFSSGMYQQTIVEPRDVPLVLRPLADRTVDAEDAVCRSIERDVASRFGARETPLVRALLIPVGPSEHVLALVMSHLAVDGWSLNVLARDLEALYWSAVERQPAQLPRIEIEHEQFADGEERRSIDRDRAALEFWLAEWLRSESAHVHLNELARPAASPPAPPAVQTFEIEPAVVSRIRTLASGMSLSPHVILRACLGIALHALTGRDLVVTWCHVANRTLETKDTVGWFNNRHIIPIDCRPARTGRQVLQQLRDSVLGALRFQTLPLTTLWRYIGRNVEHECAHEQIMFDYHTESTVSDRGGCAFHRTTLLKGTWARAASMDIRVVESSRGLAVYGKCRSRQHAAALAAVLAAFHRCTLRLLWDVDAVVSSYRACVDPRGEPQLGLRA